MTKEEWILQMGKLIKARDHATVNLTRWSENLENIENEIDAMRLHQDLVSPVAAAATEEN